MGSLLGHSHPEIRLFRTVDRSDCGVSHAQQEGQKQRLYVGKVAQILDRLAVTVVDILCLTKPFITQLDPDRGVHRSKLADQLRTDIFMPDVVGNEDLPSLIHYDGGDLEAVTQDQIFGDEIVDTLGPFNLFNPPDQTVRYLRDQPQLIDSLIELCGDLLMDWPAVELNGLGPQLHTGTLLLSDLLYQVLVVDIGTDPQRKEQGDQNKSGAAGRQKELHDSPVQVMEDVATAAVDNTLWWTEPNILKIGEETNYRTSRPHSFQQKRSGRRFLLLIDRRGTLHDGVAGYDTLLDIFL